MIRNGNAQIQPDVNNDNGVFMFNHRYRNGDQLEVVFNNSQSEGKFWNVRLDASLPATLVYLKQNKWLFKIPMSLEDREVYGPLAFSGTQQFISIQPVEDGQLDHLRNLALNIYDQHTSNAYPHVAANVETQNKAIFAARNVIDGYVASGAHGYFPYQSWGIDNREDAELTIDFGRKVQLESVGIVLRTDFPHDSYWTNGCLELEPDASYQLVFKKTATEQIFHLPVTVTSRLKLGQLIKANDQSIFPSLIELKAYGHELKGGS